MLVYQRVHHLHTHSVFQIKNVNFFRSLTKLFPKKTLRIRIKSLPVIVTSSLLVIVAEMPSSIPKNSGGSQPCFLLNILWIEHQICFTQWTSAYRTKTSKDPWHQLRWAMGWSLEGPRDGGGPKIAESDGSTTVLMMILRVMCLSCWEKLQSTINKSHLFESFRIYILNF